MSVRKPLVNVDGRVSELPVGDTISGASGGGGSSIAAGSAIINFGSAPGTNVVSVSVTGQSSILSTSQARAYFMADSTASHNAYEHQVAPIRLTAGPVVSGVGFDITAVCDWRLTGTFKVRWEWV